MYPERGESYSPKWSTGKVTDICAKLLSELEKDPKRNILPILSCLVRRGGDDGVEAALRRIDRSRRDEAAEVAEAAEALDFLLLLVDVNHLFNVALGLYDFELVSYYTVILSINSSARGPLRRENCIFTFSTFFCEQVLFVAERSQKDPKEYLPFLNELKSHSPPAYRRYKIDLHLKRHKSALKNLSEIHDEHREEVIELIRSRNNSKLTRTFGNP